jgi:chromosome segregation ATPase
LSAAGKAVSSKRADLERLCDHFNIDVENPINVMGQDTSRQFLQKGSDKDKYDFFVKAMLLETIQAQLSYLRERLKEMEAVVAEKEGQVTPREEGLKALEEEMGSYSELEALRATVDGLKKKLAWALVDDLEAKADEAAAVAADINTAKLPKVARHLAQRTQELGEAEQAKADALRRIQDNNADITGDVAARNATAQAFKDAAKQEQAAKRQLGESQRALDDCRRKEGRLKGVLETARQTQAKETGAAAQRLDGLIEQAHAHVATARTALDDARQVERDAQTACETARGNVAGSASGDAELDAQENLARDTLERLSKAKTDAAQLHGPVVAKLLQMLQQPESKARFVVQPMGPISALLRLSDKAWAVAVDDCLGKVLDSFIVANHKDGLVLQEMSLQAARAVLPANHPGSHQKVSVLTYTDLGCSSVYAMNPAQLPPPELTSVLSVLRCPIPGVLNLCIDQTGIERQVLVGSREEANRVLLDNAGRQTVQQVYTRDGTRFFTRGGTVAAVPRSKDRHPRLQAEGVDISHQMAQAEQRLREVKQRRGESQGRKKELQKAVRDADTALQDAKKKRAAAEAALNNCQHDLDDLRKEQAAAAAAAEATTEGDGGADELAAELEALREEEHTLVDVLSRMRQQAEEVSQRTAAAKAALDDMAGRMKGKAAEADELQEAFHTAAKEVDRLAEQVTKLQGLQQGLQQKLGEATATEKDARAEAEGEAFKASQLCPRAAADAVQLPPAKGAAAGMPPGRERLLALLKQAEGRVSRETARNKRPYEQVTAELSAAARELRQLRNIVVAIKEPCERMKQGYTKRLVLLKKTTKQMQQTVSNNFNVHLQSRGHSGRIIVRHDTHELELSVQMRNTGGEAKSVRVKDTRQLSGGERSFTTLCFIMAMNELSECPFCCLDEWDVFMDVVHRKVSLDKMMQYTQQHREKQFILITPLDLGNIVAGPLVRIHRCVFIAPPGILCRHLLC